MLSEFLIDYILWVFFGALGAFQFVVAKNGLPGGMIVRGFPRLTMGLGLALVLLATVVYFAGEPRNQPDEGLGLDANVQARWFAISTGLAIGLTLAVTSLINHRWGARHGWDDREGLAPPSGVSWLQRTTFARALAAQLRFRRRARDGREASRQGSS
jgi:hypothetical protein